MNALAWSSPLLLAGLAALAVPVLVHLVDREDTGGVGFPSVMFLRRVRIPRRRRRRLRDRVLLALRCLALAALAAGFAGPHLPDAGPVAAPSGDGGDTVLLLDRSYSMGFANRWPQALGAARARVDALAPGERMALGVFDEEGLLLSPLTDDAAALRRALGDVRPGARGTDFGVALSLAARALERSASPRRAVVLVSDLQAAGAARGDLALDAGVALEVVPVAGGDDAGNVAITFADAPARATGSGPGRRTVLARVRNTAAGSAPAVAVRLEVDGRPVDERTVDLAPGEERTVEFPLVLPEDRPSRVRLHTGPDALAADDERRLVLGPSRPLRVLLAGARPAAGGELFVASALALAREPAFAVERVRMEDLDGASLEGVDVVVAHDVPVVSPLLARFVRDGGGLFVVAGEGVRGGWPAGPDGYLPGRMGPVAEPAGGVPLVLGASGRHPVLAGLLERGGDALAPTRVRRYRELEVAPGDQVLARFGDGSPALVERRHGEGRTLVLTTTPADGWSTLGVQPGFVPLVVEVVRHLAARPRSAPARRVGDRVDVARYAAGVPGGEALAAHLAAGGTVLVESPDGGQHRMRAGAAVLTPDAAGFYELHGPDTPAGPTPLAVNVDAAESELRALTAEAFERRVRRPAPAALSRGVAGAGAPAGGRMPPIAWLLLAAAGVALAAEAWLANRTGRRRAVAITGAAT